LLLALVLPPAVRLVGSPTFHRRHFWLLVVVVGAFGPLVEQAPEPGALVAVAEELLLDPPYILAAVALAVTAVAAAAAGLNTITARGLTGLAVAVVAVARATLFTSVVAVAAALGFSGRALMALAELGRQLYPVLVVAAVQMALLAPKLVVLVGFTVVAAVAVNLAYRVAVAAQSESSGVADAHSHRQTLATCKD
jgi:hypothetical protein